MVPGRRNSARIDPMKSKTTWELRDEVESYGYQFLRDDGGWVCYDADDRSEVPGTRHRQLGESVWLAASALGI